LDEFINFYIRGKLGELIFTIGYDFYCILKILGLDALGFEDVVKEFL